MAAIGLTYFWFQMHSEQLFDSPQWLRVTVYRLTPTINIAFLWIVVTRYMGTGRSTMWRGWTAAGKESMAIYLYHVAAMMPLRVVLPHISSAAAQIGSVVVATIIGVIGPMCLSRFVLSPVPVLNAALLGAPLKRGKS